MSVEEDGVIERNLFPDITLYVHYNNITTFAEGEPLTRTHHIRRKGAVRYDFLFMNEDLPISSMQYCYEPAIAAAVITHWQCVI